MPSGGMAINCFCFFIRSRETELWLCSDTVHQELGARNTKLQGPSSKQGWNHRDTGLNKNINNWRVKGWLLENYCVYEWTIRIWEWLQIKLKRQFSSKWEKTGICLNQHYIYRHSNYWVILFRNLCTEE